MIFKLIGARLVGGPHDGLWYANTPGDGRRSLPGVLYVTNGGPRPDGYRLDRAGGTYAHFIPGPLAEKGVMVEPRLLASGVSVTPTPGDAPLPLSAL